MAMKELLTKTLYNFNLLDEETRLETYKSVLRYVEVFNAVFENTTATFNIKTVTIEFTTN